MRWSLAIGRVKGTNVRVHLTFFLFLLWIGIAFYIEGGTVAAVDGITFLLLLFLCVVLHEFGHIFAARHFGVGTSEILLLPIGGIARLERIPERPREELLMALAGPAVTLAIALVLVLALGGLPDPRQILAEPTGRSLAAQLAYANLTLLAFNLLPVFPLDGGRVLRALLSARLGHLRGTRVAATIGRGAAVLLGLLAFAGGHIFLVLIALFIYIAAGSEAGMARMRGSLNGVPARDVMITKFETLPDDAPVSDAAEALIRTSQREFPVVDCRGAVTGVLTRDGIVKALMEESAATPVGTVMERGVPTISPWHQLEDTLGLLEQGRPVVAVTGPDGRPVGLVTWENLVERLMLADAVDRQRGAGAARLGAAGHPYHSV